MPAETIVLNGISGETGNYLVPPLEPSRVAALVKGEVADQGVVRWLGRVWRKVSRPFLGLPLGVDPTDVSQAGWAIVFSTDEPQEVRDALGRLIEHRQALCGEKKTKVLDIRPGEKWQEWLERHGDAPGTVTPTKVPFYLLLVGSPERISYEHQYLLSVERAVGRLHFDSVDGYTRYVQSLIDHEQGQMPPRARVAAFLGTRHDFDAATQLSADLLVRPLAYGTPGLAAEPAEPGVADRWGFATRAFVKDSATKANLAELLHGTVGGEAIAFAFTATHGMGWPVDSADQQAKQGALLSQDWPGIGSISASQYLTAAEVSDDARVQGMILFHFACYGAGTPRYDNFLHEPGQPPPAVADQAFVAALPKRMLSHPNGAALAVIGHVERAWGCSFVSQASGPQLQPFRNAIGRILTQAPVGYAMRDFRERYAALSTNLSNMLQDINSYQAHIDDDELADAWLERNDAQNYTVTGDPAVRLRVHDPAES
jgi:hypothetical protein